MYGIRNEVSFVIPSLQPSHKKKKEAAATQLLAPSVLGCAELCSAVLCWVLWARPRRTGVRYGIILIPSLQPLHKEKEGGRLLLTSQKPMPNSSRRGSGGTAEPLPAEENLCNNIGGW